MAETIDLCPANVDGRLVYVAPAPLSIDPSGFWIAVSVVLALVAALAGKEDRR
jgi:hypothetical protein